MGFCSYPAALLIESLITLIKKILINHELTLLFLSHRGHREHRGMN
jgi:hypothetical protein